MTKLKKEIQIDGPANLLATVPNLLGFSPEKSLVVVAVKGNNDQVVVTMTLDLPKQFDTDFIDNLKETIKRSGADGLVAVFYTEEISIELKSVANLFMEKIAPELHIRDILWVSQGRWASFLCADEMCCPVGGRELDLSSTSIAKAELVLAGRGALSKRSDLKDFLAVTKIDKSLVPLINQFSKQKTKADHNENYLKWGKTQFRFLSQQKAFIDFDAKLWARLLFGLTDIPVRDALLSHHIELAKISEDPSQYLTQIAQQWAQVARVAPDAFRPPICTCVAALMWQAGEGILARSALDFVVALDPEFHLAKLLNSALNSGMPPWEFRDAFTKITNPWS